MIWSACDRFVSWVSDGEENAGLKLQCPHCAGWLGYVGEAIHAAPVMLLCSSCYAPLRCKQGIWRALPPESESYFAQFMTDYEAIRAAEGRGSAGPEYYLNLPYSDLSGCNTAQWAIRACTYTHIEQRLLPDMEARFPRKLRILDLGAGNGWLSYRLALRGHAPVAVDLQVNDRDGLGAAHHYKSRLAMLFPRFQAEVDRLPFTGGQFDLAIFNASFHYSENYERTLKEAIRCTRPGGMVLIADTPWYSSEVSGQRMVAERKADFIARYGTASDGIASLEFLTDRRLEALEDRFRLHWGTHTPDYGILWGLRPLLAELRGRREPARFRIYTAEVDCGALV